MEMTKDEAAARLTVQLTEQGCHGVLTRQQFGPEPDDWGLIICRAQTGHDGPCDTALCVPVPQSADGAPFQVDARQTELLRHLHEDLPGDDDDGEPDLLTIAEAAGWFLSQPGTVLVPPSGIGALLVFGEPELAALARLLSGIDADAVPDGADLTLFAMLTAAVRQGLAGAS